MNCPGCQRPDGSLLFEDKIDCSCGETITLTYYTCHHCGFTWRLNNGVFISGGLIDEASLNMAIESIIDATAGYEEDDDSTPLSDALHNCIRCGRLATETDSNKFMCVNCGFEWEVEDYVG